MKIRSLDDVSEILEKKPQDNSPKINLSEHSSDAMKLEIYQPWANPVIKFKAPESIIDEMMKVTDKLVDENKKERDFSESLVGQVSKELKINVTEDLTPNTSEFFTYCVGNFVHTALKQSYAAEEDKYAKFCNETMMVKINSMWVVSQYPHEYNPIHIHTGCKVSSVMYLKVPKFKKDRKNIRKQSDMNKGIAGSDGQITFSNSTSADSGFASPICSFTPKVGDMFVFASLQQHMVWPFRCDEEDKERRSVSFNADFTTGKRK